LKSRFKNIPYPLTDKDLSSLAKVVCQTNQSYQREWILRRGLKVWKFSSGIWPSTNLPLQTWRLWSDTP